MPRLASCRQLRYSWRSLRQRHDSTNLQRDLVEFALGLVDAFKPRCNCPGVYKSGIGSGDVPVGRILLRLGEFVQVMTLSNLQF